MIKMRTRLFENPACIICDGNRSEPDNKKGGTRKCTDTRKCNTEISLYSIHKRDKKNQRSQVQHRCSYIHGI